MAVGGFSTCPWCGADVVQATIEAPECAAECGWDAELALGPDADTVLGDTGIIYVCAQCGDPVETIPCAQHQPVAFWTCWR